MATQQLEIENVFNPTYVSLQTNIATKNPIEFVPGTCEVYAGTITVTTSGLGEDDGNTVTDVCRILVPISSNPATPSDNPSKNIRSYGAFGPDVPAGNGPPQLFNAAVCVSLAGTAPSPLSGHTAIEAVNKADVVLVQQQFPGIVGTQLILVLEFEIAYRHTTILRVAYNITVAAKTVGLPPLKIKVEDTLLPNNP